MCTYTAEFRGGGAVPGLKWTRAICVEARSRTADACVPAKMGTADKRKEFAPPHLGPRGLKTEDRTNRDLSSGRAIYGY
jgi:hypothetical protein